jgi:hypothetical protein
MDQPGRGTAHGRVEKQFKKSSALDTTESTITAGAPGTYNTILPVHPKMTNGSGQEIVIDRWHLIS